MVREGEEREGGTSSWGKKHEGDRLIGYHVLFFCKLPANLSTVSCLKAKWMSFSLKLAEVKHCSRQRVSHHGWLRGSWEMGVRRRGDWGWGGRVQVGLLRLED